MAGWIIINRDAAASGCNNNCAAIHQCFDGLSMHDVFRHWRGNHAAPLSRLLFPNAPAKFFSQRFCFFCGISCSHIFGWIFDGRIIFIHDHLGNQGYDFTIHIHIPQFILQGLLDHITNGALGACNTNAKRKRRYSIVSQIHAKKFIPDLWAVSMINT